MRLSGLGGAARLDQLGELARTSLPMNKLVESIGFPPIPQETRNGWGTARLG
jgi:hypothetical protein